MSQRVEKGHVTTMRIGVLTILALSFFPALRATAAAHDWKDYANVLYSYRICYPADLMTQQPESDNADGRLFTAPSGATLRVWGHYNANDENVAVLSNDLLEAGATITYRHVDATRGVVSGKQGENIFYAETLLEKDDIVLSFVLTYPERQAAAFDTVADQLSHCFTRLVP